jgi:nucleoside-diphosphate-sugar epimerase
MRPTAAVVTGSGPATTVVRSARTSKAKLKRELGWTPRYPTVEIGIPAALAAIGR